jgi:hypothetical protein
MPARPARIRLHSVQLASLHDGIARIQTHRLVSRGP